MPKGIYQRTIIGRENMSLAHKGKHHPNSGFQKGNHPKTEFKKGHSKLKNAYKWFIGENHFNWKGGRIKSSHGYIMIYNPYHPNANKDGYVYEHRLIVEKQIGRYLHRWEVSHHINKIKDDNCLENLMAFVNNSAHMQFEKRNKINFEKIIFDGKKLTKEGGK